MEVLVDRPHGHDFLTLLSKAGGHIVGRFAVVEKDLQDLTHGNSAQRDLRLDEIHGAPNTAKIGDAVGTLCQWGLCGSERLQLELQGAIQGTMQGEDAVMEGLGLG